MPANQSGADDLQRMQQEAIRRVREMQARAHVPEPAPPPEPRREAQHEVHQGERHEESHNGPVVALGGPQPAANPIENIFESLMEDSDRTLILILLLILMGEEADISLIFALMYLIL